MHLRKPIMWVPTMRQVAQALGYIGYEMWPLCARVQSPLEDTAKQSINHSNMTGALTRSMNFPSPECTQDRVCQFRRRGSLSHPGEPCVQCQNMNTQVSSEAIFLQPQTLSSLQIGVSNGAHCPLFLTLLGLLYNCLLFIGVLVYDTICVLLLPDFYGLHHLRRVDKILARHVK